jgi:hypothetical protein
MHPDSIVIDFEKDENGNITKTVFTTIIQEEIRSIVVPYHFIVNSICDLFDDVLLANKMNELILETKIRHEIEEMIR